MPWITQKQFAEEVGCTTANVTIGIRRGRIALEWVKREGARSVMINTEAIPDWHSTARSPKTVAKRPVSGFLPPPTTQRQPGEVGEDAPILLWGQPPADGSTDEVAAELEQQEEAKATAGAGQPRHESERRSAELRARLLEIDLAKEENLLMDAKAVKKAWFETGRQIMQRILGIPARVAADIAAMSEPAEIAIFLEKELVNALEALNDDLPG
jgi:hypothetical protein